MIIIAMEADLAVCDEAHDARQAMSALETLQPDLVLLDMSLSCNGGLEMFKDIGAFRPQTPALIISMHDETLYAERVIRAGGRGYIMKQEGSGKIIQAIRRLVGGGISVSESISLQILDDLSGAKRGASLMPRAGLVNKDATTSAVC